MSKKTLTNGKIVSKILRVVKEGGEIEITGIKSNKEFFNIYSGEVEVPKGFDIIEVGEIP